MWFRSQAENCNLPRAGASEKKQKMLTGLVGKQAKRAINVPRRTRPVDNQGQRSQAIALITKATTSNAPRTYLLAANHDRDGAAELENIAEVPKPAEFAGGCGISVEERSDVCTELGAVCLGAATAFRGVWAAPVGCGRRWPRHFFSSHSTQKVRPCDTGKPQALHFCRFLKTRGTETDVSTSSVLPDA
jgi:hypothetical protein